MTIKKRFEVFHAENPLVYYFFMQFTFDAIENGNKRFSADMIMHQIRDNKQIRTEGEKFKVNNDYVALYARKFMKDYPQHKGIFQTRRRKTA
jgi:hypothetical protein